MNEKLEKLNRQKTAAEKKLDTLIEERRKMLTTDGSENPLF